eukprot:GILI01042464.1.p1 GENE.GILI01042464.1~~GILI01042464.1.p1  ORF type:complete len:156 (-),score=41.22 GILI01042464.1:11-478(-)
MGVEKLQAELEEASFALTSLRSEMRGQAEMYLAEKDVRIRALEQLLLEREQEGERAREEAALLRRQLQEEQQRVALLQEENRQLQENEKALRHAHNAAKSNHRPTSRPARSSRAIALALAKAQEQVQADASTRWLHLLYDGDKLGEVAREKEREV